jgi:nucleotide-binding universal stress UspA family protein
VKKILCTTDETEVSRKAEGFACEMAKALGAELHFVHVSPVTPNDLKTPGNFDAVILEEVDARNHEVLKKASETAKHCGISDAIFLTLSGHDTAKVVVNYAETEGCDMIVTGSNGRVGVPRLIIGSVSSSIIHKAHCPVTVVR